MRKPQPFTYVCKRCGKLVTLAKPPVKRRRHDGVCQPCAATMSCRRMFTANERYDLDEDHL